MENISPPTAREHATPVPDYGLAVQEWMAVQRPRELLGHAAIRLMSRGVGEVSDRAASLGRASRDRFTSNGKARKNRPDLKREQRKELLKELGGDRAALAHLEAVMRGTGVTIIVKSSRFKK